jgi:hypothetical protein
MLGFITCRFMEIRCKKLIGPGLLNCLKGKACFHIKKFDKEIFLQIKEALDNGYKIWHKRGWL